MATVGDGLGGNLPHNGQHPIDNCAQTNLIQHQPQLTTANRMAFSPVYMAVMLGSWLMALVAGLCFRKPGAPFISRPWNPLRPCDFMTPIGVKLWLVGIITFLLGWVVGLISMFDR